MKSKIAEGIIVPLVTPMDEKEKINLEPIPFLVDRMIENGVDGIFAFGTNGEGYILSFDEKKEVLEAVIDAVKGRVPVYAGTGAVSSEEAIRLGKMAEESGADALSVITPSFARASQDELYEYYRRISCETSLPIILYNIPDRTGNAIAPKTVGRLAKIENIIGVKDSSGDFANILSYIQESKAVKDDFAVLSGNDRLIIWTLLAGGKGGIAGCANVYPKTLSSIYDLYLEGRIEEAIRVNESLSAFRSLFRLGNSNTVVKTAVNLLGIPAGPCRSPFNMLGEKAIEEIRKTLDYDRKRGLC